MVKNLFRSFMFVALLPLDSSAETRQEIRELSDRSEFYYNTQGLQHAKEREIELNEVAGVSEKVGFYEKIRFSSQSNQLTQALSSAYFKNDFYESVLIVKLLCSTGSELFNLNYKYRNVSWELRRQNGRDSKVSTEGEAQTDAGGMLRIRMSSRGRLDGEILTLKVGESSYSVTLGKGPYEFLLLERVCARK